MPCPAAAVLLCWWPRLPLRSRLVLRCSDKPWGTAAGAVAAVRPRPQRPRTHLGASAHAVHQAHQAAAVAVLQPDFDCAFAANERFWLPCLDHAGLLVAAAAGPAAAAEMDVAGLAARAAVGVPAVTAAATAFAQPLWQLV